MARRGWLSKLERLETHHRIAAFCIIIVATIIITRLIVFVYDPRPVIFGLELHHFDYGILLLLISSQLSLFGPPRFRDLYIVLTAIASSLILDEYWMIRHGLAHGYTASFFPVMVLVIVVVLAVLFIASLLKQRI